MTREDAWREDVAALGVRRERGYQVDLIARVGATDEPVCAASIRTAVHDNDIPTAGCPLALHPEKTPLSIEDEVVSKSVRQWPEHTDTQLDRGQGNRRFCDGPLLVRIEHTTNTSSCGGRNL